MKQRGRPVRGAIAGLFFGLFVSIDLVVFGVVALDSNVLVLFPVLGLIGGIALGLPAPLHRRADNAPVEDEAGPAGDEPARLIYAEITDDRPVLSHPIVHPEESRLT